MLGFELVGELDLDDLVLEVVLLAEIGRQVDVRHQLHRQRRSALDAATFEHVPERCPQQRLVVDAAVLEETPVLDRDGGLAQVVGLLRLSQVSAQHV